MKFFKEDKWDAWWNNLSPNTQEYLKNQPLWHDRDLAEAVAFSLVVGYILGKLI
jgi:hypothetical protein